MPEAFNQARFIADRFGGVAALAEQTRLPYHRVADWCRRTGYIPEKHRLEILRAAALSGVDLTAFDFIRHLVKTAD